MLRPGARKAALCLHVSASIGWMGAVAVFLALAIVGLTSGERETVQSAYVAMDAATTFVIVPLAFGALATGVLQSIGTPWGLVRHYWVLAKLAITTAATLVLCLQLSTISRLAEVAGRGHLGSGDLDADRASMVVHAGAGLLVLAVPLVLSIYKPRGMTTWGRRRARGSASDREHAPGREPSA